MNGNERNISLNIVVNGAAIHAKTLQIRVVQVTTNNVSDSQVFGDLLDQIPQDEQIDSVYTNGAYDTMNSHRFCRHSLVR